MYRVVAGIALDEREPAYKHIVFQPRPGGGLTFAKASVQSMYGRVAVGWNIAAGKMTLTVEVPPTTTASVMLPESTLQGVSEGGKTLANRDDMKKAHQDGNA